MQFLFERLSILPRGLDGRQEPFDQNAAIVAQIQRIASTGRLVGQDIPAVPWGMPSVVTMGASAIGMIDAYAQALREAIVRHEPRLREVRVETERTSDALSPWRLVVSAVFPDEDQPRNVCVAAPF